MVYKYSKMCVEVKEYVDRNDNLKVVDDNVLQLNNEHVNVEQHCDIMEIVRGL